MMMHPNEALLHHFYTCFQQKDYAGMQACYADTASFTDEAFVNLNAAQVRAMWEMLIKRGKDMQLSYSNIAGNAKEGSANWVAIYSFSASGRKVENRIKSSFLFADGKIVQQRDYFNFYTWSRQALGLPGWLLGFTPMLRKKVQQKAMQGLADFMQKNNLQ
jgi:ketosteroid isomerase-like protein